MNQKSFVALFLMILLLLGGYLPSVAQSTGDGLPHSMKGYELYSWRTRRQWYFSLVAGTNRQKTYQEITSPRFRIKGIERLKRKLDLLPKGEELFWSTHRMRRMTLPPRAIIDEIVDYCKKRGLVLMTD